jgi:uncharacterized membrane protein
VERAESSVEVDCPVRTVYNQWTQFEEFPRFMSGVKEVTQLDDTHVRWRATICGVNKQWDAEITEQVPDERISWRSSSGVESTGTVRFAPLTGDRTLVHVAVDYAPKETTENRGDALGAVTAYVASSIRDFKRYIEERQVADGAWRGEIHDGACEPQTSDRRPSDARTRQ